MMDIVLTGSVAFDYLMTFPGYFRDHILPERIDTLSLSFLVESMVRRRGGTAPNIAYTLALLGERPRLMATVGEDFDAYRQWLEEMGVNTTAVRVIKGEFTASFFVNTDRANSQIASFYPGAMAYAGELSFHDISGELPDLVMISPNEPGAMNRYGLECLDLGIPYIYDPSQQIVRLGAEDLQRGIVGAQAMFINEYEFELIKKKTGLGIREILNHQDFCVITLGENGSEIHTQDGKIHIPVVQPEQIGDPTGVGDAFRGGFLSGYSRSWPLELCGQVGALAATYCLECSGSLGHSYTKVEFITRFRETFSDGGVLDALVGPAASGGIDPSHN